jgi:AraC family transcriptional regulator
MSTSGNGMAIAPSAPNGLQKDTPVRAVRSTTNPYRTSRGIEKVETITRVWRGVSVYYNEKYPGNGVAWADLSSEETTLVICLEQRGGICEPRLHINQATPRTRYDMGYFIWVPANHSVYGYAESVHFVRDITLKFNMDHVKHLLGGNHDYSNIEKPMLMIYDSKVTQCAHLLANACVDPYENDDVFGGSLVTALLSAVLHATSRSSEETLAGGLAPWQLRATKEYMEQNYRSEVSLGGLARIARLSESRFARAFKASTGTPPYAWLLQQRVRKAQELLAATEQALSEIAVQVGFANQSHFTKAFRRITGLTPREWQLTKRASRN